MSRGLSRNNNKLVWQYIDAKYLSQYIDNLKSRIYKAFIQKSTKKIYSWQLHFIDSPLVICLALKQKIESSDINFSSFEFGYVIIFFNFVDISTLIFCICSRKNNLSLFKKKIDDLIVKVRYRIINWIVEIYIDYLYYRNNFSFLRLYRSNTLYTVSHKNHNDCRYAINVNLIDCMYYINIFSLINKLYLIDHIKKYLYRLFGKGIFLKLMIILRLSEGFSILEKSGFSLVKKIIDLLILTWCYEIATMFSLEENIDFTQAIIIIPNIFHVLVMCQQPNQLYLWKKYLVYLLISNGVKLRNIGNIFPNSLLQGINFKHDFIIVNYELHPALFIFRPSLYYQYILLKLTSIMLTKSRSKPSFLLIIRLNKLLLVWSKGSSENCKKIFLLLDYLIYLKIKCFLKYKKKKLVQKKIHFQYLMKLPNNLKYSMKKASYCFSTTVNNELYYRQYCIFKLSWF